MQISRHGIARSISVALMFGNECSVLLHITIPLVKNSPLNTQCFVPHNNTSCLKFTPPQVIANQLNTPSGRSVCRHCQCDWTGHFLRFCLRHSRLPGAREPFAGRVQSGISRAPLAELPYAHPPPLPPSHTHTHTVAPFHTHSLFTSSSLTSFLASRVIHTNSVWSLTCLCTMLPSCYPIPPPPVGVPRVGSRMITTNDTHMRKHTRTYG